MTRKHKNPFAKLTKSELEIITKKELEDDELDDLIFLMIDKIKKYYKLKFYQKLYYYNTHLKNTQTPYPLTDKPNIKTKKTIFVSFD